MCLSCVRTPADPFFSIGQSEPCSLAESAAGVEWSFSPTTIHQQRFTSNDFPAAIDRGRLAWKMLPVLLACPRQVLVRPNGPLFPGKAGLETASVFADYINVPAPACSSEFTGGGEPNRLRFVGFTRGLPSKSSSSSDPFFHQCTALDNHNITMEDLDVSQLATYLHINPDKIVKMATRGRLPGRRVGGQWRFSEAEIHHWVEDQIGASDGDELVRFEQVVTPKTVTSPTPTIASLCPATRIEVPLAGRTRGSVIRRMCDLATTGGMMWDAAAMRSAVESREEMHPTALQCGVALMHPRRPQTSILADSVIALGICASPIPFSGHGQLTDVFFLICSYDDPIHLRILARISRLITNTDLLDTLRGCDSSTSAHQAIVDAERVLQEIG